MQRKAVGVADPIGQAVAQFFVVRLHSGQQRAGRISERYRVACRDFGGNTVAVQTVDRVLGHQRAGKAPRSVQRNDQLQHGRVAVFAHGLVIKGGARVARAQKQGVVFGVAAQGRCGLGLYVPYGRRPGRRTNPAVFIDPGQALDFGVAVEHHVNAHARFFGAGLVVRNLPGEAIELVLPFSQALAQGLLRVFHVALYGFLLAVDLLYAQVGQRGNDSQKENQYRGQWRQHGHPVLLVRIELAPPRANAANNGPFQTVEHGGSVGDAHRLTDQMPE